MLHWMYNKMLFCFFDSISEQNKNDDDAPKCYRIVIVSNIINPLRIRIFLLACSHKISYWWKISITPNQNCWRVSYYEYHLFLSSHAITFDHNLWLGGRSSVFCFDSLPRSKKKKHTALLRNKNACSFTRIPNRHTLSSSITVSQKKTDKHQIRSFCLGCQL